MRRVFSFPETVNEVSARLVAGGVVIITLLIVIGGQHWLLPVLAYGFVARALSGPTLSPLGQFVTRVVTPALPFEPKIVPGPPKRFAQAIGATLSVSALIAYYVIGSTTATLVLISMITIAASLESFLGYCLGCQIFGLLMKAGVISPEVCEACNNFSVSSVASSS